MKDIKAEPGEFAKLKAGEQTHLLRLNENFAINETVCVREFDAMRSKYTDQVLTFRIASMESGAQHPAVLSPRFVILSLAPLPPAAVLT